MWEDPGHNMWQYAGQNMWQYTVHKMWRYSGHNMWQYAVTICGSMQSQKVTVFRSQYAVVGAVVEFYFAQYVGVSLRMR